MKIILNADDFGMTHEANLGVKKAMEEGYCSQTSIVVNTNYFDEAAEIAHKYGFTGKIGLHINLFEGTPLTGGIKKLRRYSRLDMFDYRPGIFSKFPIGMDEIGEELEAQIQKYKEAGFTLMNIDSHHCAFYDVPVLLALMPLLRKYDFQSVRYIGASYFNGNIWRELYGRYWIRKMDQLSIRHANYSSSVATYMRNKRLKSPCLRGESKIEVYVHPIMAGGYLYDNYTGGKRLKKSLWEAGIDSQELITSKDI